MKSIVINKKIANIISAFKKKDAVLKFGVVNGILYATNSKILFTVPIGNDVEDGSYCLGKIGSEYQFVKENDEHFQESVITRIIDTSTMEQIEMSRGDNITESTSGFLAAMHHRRFPEYFLNPIDYHKMVMYGDSITDAHCNSDRIVITMTVGGIEECKLVVMTWVMGRHY
jgi:hypothetical protein